MHRFLVLAIAIFLDRLFDKPGKDKPLQAFTNIATYIDNTWHGQEELIAVKGSQPKRIIELIVQFKGLLAMLFLVLPCLALIIFLDTLSQLNFIFDVIFVYLSIGAEHLRQNCLAVEQALSKNDHEQTSAALQSMVNFDITKMSQQEILNACVESVLQNGNYVMLAPIFWFVVLGAPGAVLYRLINQLSILWNCKNPRYSNFGRAAGRLNFILSFIPACLTALSYMLLGQMKSAWKSLLKLGPLSANAHESIILAAGAGALNIEKQPQLPDIMRAYNLAERSLILWLAVIFIRSLSHY